MTNHPFLLPVTIILLMTFCPDAPMAGTPRLSAVLNTSDEDSLRTIHYTYGLNLGAYFANNGTANYYNGSGHHSLENAITRQQTYHRIRESLGYDFELHGLPEDMGYSPAILVGVFGTLQLTGRTSLHGEFNFARLKASDQFTLKLKKPTFIEGDNVKRYSLSGTEERSEIKIGVQHTFLSTRSSTHPFVETGISLTNTRVRENSARIEGSTVSIRNISDTYYDFRDDGIGMGTYASLGIRMDLGDAYALALGAGSHFKMIKLGSNDTYFMQFTLFTRLFLSQ